MSNKISKSEMILKAALELFSRKGYDGVGIDEIGDAVGMKGPAIYHYFKGKEALFDAIAENLDIHYNANISAEGIMPETIDELIDMSMKRIEFTVHDPMIKMMRRFLAIEQFRNDRMKALTTKHHLTGIVEMNTAAIRHLADKGEIITDDPELLALEFSAPVSMLIHLIDREPERENEAMETIKKHHEHFVKTYGCK